MPYSSHFKTVRLLKNDNFRQKLAGVQGVFCERCLIFRLNLKLAVFAHFRSFKPQTLDRLIFRSTIRSLNPSTAAKQYFCKGRGPNEWSWNPINTPCQQIQFKMVSRTYPLWSHWLHVVQGSTFRLLFSNLELTQDHVLIFQLSR